ncbi:Uma2 family endonuclease [Streptomyces himalayensis]|uniref:Uma2 family endonuclease n=1 Tax=Streptomyces himalayensis subsp. himalayensis TaxID=2756131 RepID=A0A7W0DS01_9ACTN|nr:Uma2 family endonuclease [Streptomyces himalayensis]MBA2949740.1 Uma2 family endonuclease [Streptomyces himalayensis subsp. himalayensis]
MTVLEDRTIMAERIEELTLDDMFAWLERSHVPEGIKVEIVRGAVYMSPQRQTHWEIIADIYEQLRARYPRQRTASDVRIDFPGHLNGFASDVAAFKEGARKDAKGRWRYQDVEFVAEVISKDTAANDYGPKLETYAAAGVPVYVIADPYTGECHVHTRPKDGRYRADLTFDFGDEIDLTDTPVGIKLATNEFPREQQGGAADTGTAAGTS